MSWIATSTWAESQSFVEDHKDDLVTGDGTAVLEGLTQQRPDDRTLLTHLGMLSVASADGIETAYRLRANVGQIEIEEPLAGGDSLERTLALARLAAGLRHGDGEVHFTHALVAARAGRHDEGRAAIASCRDASATWERNHYAGRLTDFAEQHPDLAEELTELRRLLVERPDETEAP